MSSVAGDLPEPGHRPLLPLAACSFIAQYYFGDDLHLKAGLEKMTSYFADGMSVPRAFLSVPNESQGSIRPTAFLAIPHR